MIRPPRRFFPTIALIAAFAISPQSSSAEDFQEVRSWRGTSFAELSETYDTLCVRGSKTRLPVSRYPIAQETAFITRCHSSPGSDFDRLALLVVAGEVSAVEVTIGSGDNPAIDEQAGEMMDYAGYRLLPAEAMVISNTQKRTMFLSPEALHSHVFLNSLTDWEDRPDRDLTGWLKEIEIGAPLEGFRRNAASTCEHHDWRRQDPAQWGWPYRSMNQLDCFGPQFMGAKRKFELVFADEKLKYAWILLAREELVRIAHALESEHGEIRPISPDLDRIGNSSLYLRKDKPELLIAHRNTVQQITGN